MNTPSQIKTGLIAMLIIIILLATVLSFRHAPSLPLFEQPSTICITEDEKGMCFGILQDDKLLFV